LKALLVICFIIPVFNYDVSKWLGVKLARSAVDDGPVRGVDGREVVFFKVKSRSFKRFGQTHDKRQPG
jgi:hypothetical protein